MKLVEKIKRKLKSESGETIVEALCALLVIVLAASSLAIALVTSAKINSKAVNEETALTAQSAGAAQSMEITYKLVDDVTKEITITQGVNLFEDSGTGYEYYSASGDPTVAEG